jgi:hypothetical protein
VRPETVEIKLNIAAGRVEPAIAALGLTGGEAWSIVFCEDVTAGLASTPLLDLGVILRAREKSAARGDFTVKLRPCRWSQLDERYFANSDDGATELKIEADWAGERRSLAASMTVKWPAQRKSGMHSGDQSVASLFSGEQRKFLTACSRGRVNLAALVRLPAFQATRWSPLSVTANGVDLRVRAERWTLGGADDFLELSVVSDVEHAPASQAALQGFAAARELAVDDSQDNKTQRVLTTLVARAGA